MPSVLSVTYVFSPQHTPSVSSWSLCVGLLDCPMKPYSTPMKKIKKTFSKDRPEPIYIRSPFQP